MFVNYPNNPTGAVVPDGFFARLVEFAREHDLLVVHDSAYSELTFDGYVAPSFLATPGAMDVGVEVFSLSKGWNMTGWRCATIVGNADAIAAYWRLKTNVDSGLFEAVQLAGAEALTGPQDSVREMCRDLRPQARPRDRRPARDRDRHRAARRARSTSGPRCRRVTPPPPSLRGGAGAVRRRRQPGLAYGPNGEGFFRSRSTVPDDRLAEAVERMRGSLG